MYAIDLYMIEIYDRFVYTNIVGNNTIQLLKGLFELAILMMLQKKAHVWL